MSESFVNGQNTWPVVVLKPVNYQKTDVKVSIFKWCYAM